MATRKTTKKTAKKVTRTAKVGSSRHTDDHSFLIIAGGGFIIIAIVMMLLGNRPTMTNATTTPTVTSEVVDTEEIISIKDFAFTPESLTVKVGTTVTWKNDDTVTHSAVSDDEMFDTRLLAPGEKGSYTFTEAGTYTYHCSTHPGMTGTIIVE